MAGTPYLASEIIVGDLANKVSIASDGSMTFADAYVPTVKLRDILGGSVVLEPAITVFVSDTDPAWVAQPINSYNQIFYKITINHNWDLTAVSDPNNIAPISTLTKIFDTDNKEIGVESIQCFANSVEIIVNKKITMKVALKKI